MPSFPGGKRNHDFHPSRKGASRPLGAMIRTCERDGASVPSRSLLR
jgi:hypothetical protein